MKTTRPIPKAFPSFADAPDPYAALRALHLPRPIKTDAEAQAVSKAFGRV